jgi:uncharacterized membrane protein (DUF441 family)
MKEAWTTIIVGVALTWLGYGGLSRRKHPELDAGSLLVGFLFRVIGPLIIAGGVLFLLFVLSGGFPW